MTVVKITGKWLEEKHERDQNIRRERGVTMKTKYAIWDDNKLVPISRKPIGPEIKPRTIDEARRGLKFWNPAARLIRRTAGGFIWKIDE